MQFLSWCKHAQQNVRLAQRLKLYWVCKQRDKNDMKQKQHRVTLKNSESNRTGTALPQVSILIIV